MTSRDAHRLASAADAVGEAPRAPETEDRSLVDARDPVDLLSALVRCPSITPAEAGTLDLLGRVLAEAGFEVERPLFREPGEPDVENLFARIGSGTPHLTLAGHVDVVPPGPEASWRHPPFAAVIEDGVLTGRGAVDMKGGLAAMVAATLDFLAARGRDFGGTLSFLITGDEEGPSVNGTQKLLAWCADRGEAFDAALVGEPTCRERLGDTVKVGRRGSLSGTVRVTGRQGHVAYPDKAANPIPLLLAIGKTLADLRLDEGTERFEPTNLEVTTVDVGNPAANVIPEAGRLAFNVRFNDAWTAAGLEARLRTAIDGVVAARTGRPGAEALSVSVAFARPSEVFLTRAERLIGPLTAAIEAETGLRPDLGTGGGTSDARFIKDYCPVAEFGLVGRTMHQVDECVPIADLECLTRTYRSFLERFFDRT